MAPANSDPISDVIKNCVFKLTWMSATMTKNNDASSKIDINAQKRTTSYLVPANFDPFGVNPILVSKLKKPNLKSTAPI